MVFQWRNDPFVLLRSSSRKTVPWEEHRRWFEEAVSGSLRCGSLREIYIVQAGEQPIGQVRFDRAEDDLCIISAYLLREFTGRGYGIEAIRLGCREIFGIWSVRNIVAYVRSDNAAARSAFAKARFAEEEAGVSCPESHVQLALSRTAFMTKAEES